MSDYLFTHGGELNCPECKGPQLICTTRNYSGCCVDIGQCEECGKAWSVAFKVSELCRAEHFDGDSRAQRNAAAEEERRRCEAERRAIYESLKKEFEDE